MQTLQLSREHRLLLACALSPLQADEIARLRDLCQSAPDWSALLKLADRHQLAPLAYTNLKRHAADLVPVDTLTALKLRAEQNRRRVLRLMAELSAISQILAPAGITLCPLKGPQLSQQLYGDVGLRVTNDLDLLLDEAQLPAAEMRLQEAGYRRIDPSVAMTPARWRVARRILRHITYEHPERRIHIEVHWTLADPEFIPPAAVQQFLARGRPLSNPALVSLAEQDLLCYLIVHGARHGWKELKWLADIAMFLRRSPSPDWLAVRGQMAALDLLRPLGQALLLARDLFGASVPAALVPLLEKSPVRRLAEQALEMILLEPDRREWHGRFTSWQTQRYQDGMKASWRFKAANFSRLWLNEGDWEDLPLPDWLFPFYIVLRPFLWLRRYYLPQRQSRE